MKKIFLFFITFIAFINFIPLLGAPVLAVTATPSGTAAPVNSRAQEILNRVTNKVTQLSEQLKKTYVGKIKSVGTSSVVITTGDGDRTVSTNEVTSLYRVRSGSRSEINFAALKSGDDLAAFGTIDPGNLEMTAKQIIAKVRRYNLAGVITANEKNVVTIKEFSGPETKVDLEGAVSLKKNLGTVFSPAKLADFKAGSTVFVIGYSDGISSSLFALKAAILNL